MVIAVVDKDGKVVQRHTARSDEYLLARLDEGATCTLSHVAGVIEVVVQIQDWHE